MYKSKEEVNAVWESKIDKVYEELDKIFEKQAAEEAEIDKEIQRLNDRFKAFEESKSYKITGKTEKTIKKQTERFEAERLQRKQALDNDIERLEKNNLDIQTKYFKKTEALNQKVNKYKMNLYTTDKPIECEFCKGHFWNSEAQRIKHEESLLHLLNAKLIDPIENGLCCSICKTTFTQYHAEPSKNPEYVECVEKCRLKYKSTKGEELEILYEKLEAKFEPIQITINNQRSVFHWLDILNSNNRVNKMIDRLEEAWEYAFGEHKKYVDKDDIRLMYLLSPCRTYIYSIDEQGNETELCNIQEAEENDGFGKGKLLIMPHRQIGYDLRDRNPFMRIPKSGLLRDLPMTEDDIKSLGLLNPNRNCWIENPETPKARKVLERVLKDNPEGKRVTRTTTTVAT